MLRPPKNVERFLQLPTRNVWTSTLRRLLHQSHPQRLFGRREPALRDCVAKMFGDSRTNVGTLTSSATTARKRIGKQTQEQESGSCALRSQTSLRSLFTLCGGGRGRLSRTQARTWPVPGTLPTLLSPHFFGSTHPRDLIFSGVDTRTFRAVRNPLTRAYEAVGGSRRSFVKRGR